LKETVEILENNQKKDKYPDGGMIYAIKSPKTKKKIN